jgi:glycosyltransferase involved in cell wall biosynthesis
MIYMTVCETEPVSPEYGRLVECKPLYVPSQFAKDVLDSQFGWDVGILRHWAPIPRIPSLPIFPDKPYIFYTIGNVIDPRKNINSLINAFTQCQFPNARLVLKATCKKTIKLDVPGVVVINGLLSDDHMEKIHQSGHCYVNCSHSEGVGMGAVEAALHDKPVIIGAYGGLKEYVHTPFVIRCPPGKIGFDDFLFKADTKWGHPRTDDLIKHMQECYERRLTHWDHSHTKDLITRVRPCLEHSL